MQWFRNLIAPVLSRIIPFDASTLKVGDRVLTNDVDSSRSGSPVVWWLARELKRTD